MLLETNDMALPKKSVGKSPSERFLAKLCERTFLSLWSWPNLCRDKGGSKENCDVLVVFGDDVLIFSDKSCEFPNTGDINHDWQKWFRRSITSSAKQVYGAERYLRKCQDQIFVDSKCTQRLPIDLPNADVCRFHRIIVARGAGARCSEFFHADTGSLVIKSDLIGDAHIDPGGAGWLPFRIGQLNPEKGFIHVFDDGNLQILLTELDTVSDFVAYLNKKEQLFTSGKRVRATGEEDILAYYLTHTNAHGEHDFTFEKDFDVVIFDHLYKGMKSNGQYIVKKQAEKISYSWDKLIENFHAHLKAGSLRLGEGMDIADFEKGVRVLASEPRLARRGLAKALMERIATATPDGPSVRVSMPAGGHGNGYVFLICPRESKQEYEDYRERRVALLLCYCKVAKMKFPDLTHVSGLATEPLGIVGRSEDLICIDSKEWTEEDEEDAREIQQHKKILTNSSVTEHREEEYPSSDSGSLGSTKPHGLNRRQRRASAARQKKLRTNLSGG